MAEFMIPIDEVLESLDLSRSEPGTGFLQALFSRFNARVLFETASKIVRNEQVSDPREKPRWPDLFWREHLELGAGGTCFSRVAAFHELLSRLGCESRRLLGRVRADFDHAALLVQIGREQWIADVGFPLPVLLVPDAGELETPLGPLRVARIGRGFQIEFAEGVPEGPRGLEVWTDAVRAEEFDEHWHRTFSADSSFLAAVQISRMIDGRRLSFSRGEIRVDDRHSRTRIPLFGSRPARLAELFGIDRSLVERAFAIVGDPDPEISAAEIAVYLEVGIPAEEAFAAIASAGGYRRLMAGAAEVSVEESGPDSWHVRLAPAGGTGPEPPFLEEEIAIEPGRRALRIRRGSQESFYDVTQRQTRSYLVRRAILPGPREDLLRNDSLRGRLAATLAVDLLAWARLLSRV